MGKERRCMHGCSDGFEKMRRSLGVKEAAKSCLRLFPFSFLFLKEILKKTGSITWRACWCALGSGRVGDTGHSVAFFLPSDTFFFIHLLNLRLLSKRK